MPGMRFRLFTDVKEFYTATYDTLMLHEAQNVIPLGNLIIGSEGKDKTDWRDPSKWFMAAVEGEQGIAITALMTPPFKLTLYATDNACDDHALRCLIEGLRANGIFIPGVMTESALAQRFAQAFTGGNYKIVCSQRIYELLRVNPDISNVGNLRLARESDMPFLPYWLEGFHSDCFGTPFTVPADDKHARHSIARGRLYILEHEGMPVSMAGISRELQTLCCIASVYTPPYLRGRGYATSCVAALSRLALRKGFNRCVLYTNLANPTSNSIYQKIGYTPLCESLDIAFE